MKCHSCHHENPVHAKFCEKCGKDLNYIKQVAKENAHSVDKLTKDSTKNTSHLISILFVLSLIILFPTKVVSSQVDVPYTETEKYDVQVPYEDIESYTVQTPYETTETYIESIPVQQQEPYTTIDCLALGLFCKEVTKYRNVTVYKDVTKARAVTKYRDETQYRKVQKVRTETREREVAKMRTETRQKEVNWLFGFDAIIKFRKL